MSGECKPHFRKYQQILFILHYRYKHPWQSVLPGSVADSDSSAKSLPVESQDADQADPAPFASPLFEARADFEASDEETEHHISNTLEM